MVIEREVSEELARTIPTEQVCDLLSRGEQARDAVTISDATGREVILNLCSLEEGEVHSDTKIGVGTERRVEAFFDCEQGEIVGDLHVHPNHRKIKFSFRDIVEGKGIECVANLDGDAKCRDLTEASDRVWAWKKEATRRNPTEPETDLVKRVAVPSAGRPYGVWKIKEQGWSRIDEMSDPCSFEIHD